MASSSLVGLFKAAGVSACLIGLAGCQSPWSAGGSADVAPEQQVTERVTERGVVKTIANPRAGVRVSDVEGFCPPARIRDGSNVMTGYAKGGQDDPTKLTYQASITTATRDCARPDGQLTITVAAAGRVVPGPVGAPASVTLPVRVYAVQGSETIFSQVIKDGVQINPSNGASQFIVKESNIVIPVPDRKNVIVYVAFDSAPAKAARAQ